jgi:hypothetical protein
MLWKLMTLINFVITFLIAAALLSICMPWLSG